MLQVKPEPEEDDGQEDEVLGVAETYADYIPAKCVYYTFYSYLKNIKVEFECLC